MLVDLEKLEPLEFLERLVSPVFAGSTTKTLSCFASESDTAVRSPSFRHFAAARLVPMAASQSSGTRDLPSRNETSTLSIAAPLWFEMN